MFLGQGNVPEPMSTSSGCVRNYEEAIDRANKITLTANNMIKAMDDLVALFGSPRGSNRDQRNFRAMYGDMFMLRRESEMQIKSLVAQQERQLKDAEESYKKLKGAKTK